MHLANNVANVTGAGHADTIYVDGGRIPPNYGVPVA
jgi:hypothetical protein